MRCALCVRLVLLFLPLFHAGLPGMTSEHREEEEEDEVIDYVRSCLPVSL